MKWSHVAEYGLVRCGAWALTRLPYQFSLAAGRGLGRAIAWLVPRRAAIVMENLRRAFPSDTAEQLSRVAREHFEHLGMSAVEFAWLSTRRRSRVLDRVSIEGQAHYESAKRQGRGTIVITSHFGNWEVLGAAFPRLEPDCSAIVFPQSNALTNRFIDRARTRNGIALIPTGLATRRIFTALRRGGAVLFVSDQDAGGGGIFVDFFGQPASTAKGPILMSLRTGAPVVMALTIREPNGHHRLVLTPPLEWTRTGDESRDVLAGTQRWTRDLEEWIRRYPPLWFWVHRRWKSKPEDRVAESEPETVHAG